MPRFHRSPHDRRRVRAAVLAVACALACAWAAAPGGAATSNIVVDATIPTVTTINPTGCQPGVSMRTDFGIVQPGSSVVTTSDCRLVVDSNAGTTQLLASQTDGLLDAMFMPARGPLDTTFDPGGAEGAGKAVSDLGGTDQIRWLEMMSDGRIVAGGRVTGDYGAARYMPDGSLDATFSPGGADGDGRARVTTAATDLGFSMALQPDGAVLLGGSTTGADDDTTIARLTSAGALDPTFGPGGADGNGIITLTRPGSNEQAYGLKVDPSGDIYVAALNTGTSDILVYRLKPDGSLDPTFAPGGADGNGMLTVDTGGSEYAYAMTIAADGDVLVAAARNSSDIVVVRVTPAGVLDTTWAVGGGDGDGISVFGNADAEAPRGIVELPDGSVVVSGTATISGNDDARVWKLTPAGVLDPTFGVGGADGNGMESYDFTGGQEVMRAIRLQPDGKLVMVGHSNNGTNDDMAFLRILPDGTPDPDFTAGGMGPGRVRIDFGAGEQAYGLVIGADGELTGGTGTGGNFAVAQLGSTTISNFTGTWATGTNTFGACLVDTSTGVASWNEVGVGNCTTATAGAWNRVAPAATDTDADVVTWSGVVTGATVDLRFGMRTALSQAPGRYIAPITFTLVGT